MGVIEHHASHSAESKHKQKDYLIYEAASFVLPSSAAKGQ